MAKTIYGAVLHENQGVDMSSKITEEIIQEMSGLTHNFINAVSPEEGAESFKAIVSLERRIEPMEVTRVQRVAGVLEWLQPQGEIQQKAVQLAKRDMGFQCS